MNVKPISEQKSQGCGMAAFGVIFGGVFFLAGSFFLWMVFLSPLLRTQASGQWLETQCTVITSKLDVNRDGDGTTYRPKIEFEYTIDENGYAADTYDFTELNRSKARCHEVISAYPVGKQTNCFVDPDDHKIAVIARDYDFSLIGFIVPMIFVLIGLGIMVGPFFLKGKGSKSISGSAKSSIASSASGLAVSNLSRASSTMSPTSHPGDIEDQIWDAPRTLKPSQKRLTTFLLTLFISLFWNGIVSFFLYGIISEGLTDGFAILPLLFMIPFALVGIILIGAVFYTFIAIFNPTVEFALSAGAIKRGGVVDLAWQLSGRTASIKSLKITIEGEEAATYRRGTNTITANNIFCSIPVAEVTDSQDIEFGSQSVTIPADTMHTFTANRNQINWRIVVHGDIPYRPDIKETYEFRVKP